MRPCRLLALLVFWPLEQLLVGLILAYGWLAAHWPGMQEAEDAWMDAQPLPPEYIPPGASGRIMPR